MRGISPLLLLAIAFGLLLSSSPPVDGQSAHFGLSGTGDASISVPLPETVHWQQFQAKAGLEGRVTDPSVQTRGNVVPTADVTWRWYRSNTLIMDPTDMTMPYSSRTYSPVTDDDVGHHIRLEATYRVRKSYDADHADYSIYLTSERTVSYTSPNPVQAWRDPTTNNIPDFPDDDDDRDTKPTFTMEVDRNARLLGQPVRATDADGDILTYTVRGRDASISFGVPRFLIDNASGQLRMAPGATLTRPQYTVQVRAYDSAANNSGAATDPQITVEADVRINVLNLGVVANLSDLTASTATSADGSYSALDIGTFGAATTSYTATVPFATTHVKLSPTAAQQDATITVRGVTVDSGSPSEPIMLSVGSNPITVKVTARDGTTKDYTLTITREEPKSTNAELSDLTASTAASAGGSYSALDIGTFSTSTTSYSATVLYEMTHLKLTPTTAHEAATVTVHGTHVSSGQESGAITLSGGANSITVRVTAEDGTTTRDYTVTVTRNTQPSSSNANLSDLTASTAQSTFGTYSSLDIGAFDAATTSYAATVSYFTTRLKLSPTAAHQAATISVDGKTVNSGQESGPISLSEGANSITVEVTAENGMTTKNYTVTITRQAEAAALGDLTNVSTRAVVGTGDEVMIGGFIIRNGSKMVLIQARGPELANAGVANALADPVLSVVDSQGMELAMNDNWGDGQRQMVIDAWGGSPNLASGSASAAAILTLEPGSYTAVVRGKDGTTGVALVEVYDLEGAQGNLVNISTRAAVGTGDEVMIGGFTIGNGSKRVLVQARGPELANAGVANALADPVLSVVDSQGMELAMNDNWGDGQRQMVIDAWGGNPNLASGSASAAAILTLEPGSYTAVVRGKDGATGVALIEVYDLD